ncbi:NADP-dependent alcohol dehydrogenase [Stachybotrys elegans]|uniref:NADP-dependent alcohol dehydrogenase n=1 Tax=Stachybotrys elegans TaxID=80388 RepID=A0A8K0WTA3_9HYPO|nr:NADP-dependent alcohol dehydrogenase [Stachybotrys elegans]
MAIEFTVFKGSSTGDIVESHGRREAGPTQVLVKITHSGLCGSDEHFRHADQGLGHEGVGVIVEVGSRVHEVSDFKVGDRVGMGWHQKFCGHCKQCVTGHHTLCTNAQSFGGANLDQGTFGTGVAWDVSTLNKIPDEIASEDAGPLMCGGATVWDPLYTSGIKPGERVGIMGVGGLGHLAIQFAAKMGLQPVVFSSSDSKKEEALKFGAAEFHVTAGKDKLEGIEPVDLMLITTSFLPDLTLYLPVLAPRAKIYPLTVSGDNVQVPALALISRGYQIIGSNLAPTYSVKDMLAFAAKNNIRPQIEKFPMTDSGITEAMKKLRDGKMRYRGVVVV